MNDCYRIEINDADVRLRACVADANLPLFPVEEDKVSVLDSPDAFYKALLNMLNSARRRIVLASLYVGHESVELVDVIEGRLAAEPELKLTVLVDYFRGQRRAKQVASGLPASSLELFKKLHGKFGSRVEFGLYHSPKAKGIWKKLLPPRYDEILGLSHFKLYAADDAVLLTGANLSSDYFSNRQDRYVLVNDAALVNFYCAFVDKVYALSYRLASLGVVEPPPKLGNLGSQSQPWSRVWINHCRTTLLSYIADARPSPETLAAFGGPKSAGKVWFLPMVQSGALNVNMEEPIFSALLDSSLAYSLTVTSGYLNFPEWMIGLFYERARNNSGELTFITSSPEANCFHQSKGISKFIPSAYTYLEQSLLERLAAAKSRCVYCKEYSRPNWSFHAKSMLIQDYTDSDSLLACTIGSSNYGYRSMKRDLELDTLIFPDSTSVQRALLAHNSTSIASYSTPVSLADFYTPRRRVPIWVKCIVRSLRSFW